MSSEELEKTIQEIWEMFRETDRRFKETDRKFEETDRKFKETDRKFKETDRRFKETDRKFRDTDRKIQEVTSAIGDLGDKWGRFVEGLVIPATKQLFSRRGIPITQVYHRAEAFHNGEQMEVDILAANKKYVIPIEVKSTLTVEDVNDHLDRLSRFKDFFPQYAHHQVIGAVAAIIFSEDSDRYAYKKGLFVIGQKGDTVAILNDENFVPKIW